MGYGDSGAPISIKRLIFHKKNREAKIEKENRNIIVGVYASGTGISVASDTMCVNTATKVSQDVVDWIKKIDSGDFSLGKIIHKNSSTIRII